MDNDDLDLEMNESRGREASDSTMVGYDPKKYDPKKVAAALERMAAQSTRRRLDAYERENR